MCYLACFWHDFRSNFKDSALQTSYPMFLGHIYKLLELDKLITIANTQLHFLSIFITKVCPKMLQRLEIKTKTSSGILSYVPSSLFFFVCYLVCVWHDFRSNFKDSALQNSYPMFLGHILPQLREDSVCGEFFNFQLECFSSVFCV